MFKKASILGMILVTCLSLNSSFLAKSNEFLMLGTQEIQQEKIIFCTFEDGEDVNYFPVARD